MRHALAYDSTRNVVVLSGGYAGKNLGDTWTFDGQDWTKLLPPSSPPASADHALGYDRDRAVVVLIASDARTWEWDGSDWHVRAPAPSNAAQGAALVYDPQHRCTVAFGVPARAELVGRELYAQGLVLDPGANVLGVVVSNGLANRIGSR